MLYKKRKTKSAGAGPQVLLPAGATVRRTKGDRRRPEELRPGARWLPLLESFIWVAGKAEGGPSRDRTLRGWNATSLQKFLGGQAARAPLPARSRGDQEFGMSQ